MTDAKELLPVEVSDHNSAQIIQSFIDCQLEAGDSAKHQLLCNVRDAVAKGTRPSPNNAGLVAAKGRALISALDHKEIGDKVAEAGVTHWEDIQIAATELDEAIAALSSPIDREAVIRECAAVAYQMFNKCTHCDTEAFAYEAASKAILALLEQEGE